MKESTDYCLICGSTLSLSICGFSFSETRIHRLLVNLRIFFRNHKSTDCWNLRIFIFVERNPQIVGQSADFFPESQIHRLLVNLRIHSFCLDLRIFFCSRSCRWLTWKQTGSRMTWGWGGDSEQKIHRFCWEGALAGVEGWGDWEGGGWEWVGK